MNTIDEARSSYHLATRLEECPFDRFWLAILDDMTEVYQSEDDATLPIPSAWMRLKELCQDTGRKIVLLVYRDRQGRNLIITPSRANGYFVAKRVRKLMSAHPAYSGYTDSAIGCGYLENGKLTITWLGSNGMLEREVRFPAKLPPTLIG